MAYVAGMVEGEPATRPAIPGAPDSVEAAAVWERLEAWTAWRWGERPVTLHVVGSGELVPPLHPFTVSTVERWADGWRMTTVDPGPFGRLDLPGEGPWRVIGTAGATDEPPAAVLEAARRLADYFGEVKDTRRARPGMTSFSDRIGELEHDVERPAGWAAKALAYSGAADLLRRYRSVPV